jgi:nucleoside-diphosphate-sugar epimerase
VPLEAKGKAMIFGSGTTPLTFTTLADASALVRHALSDPALLGRTIEWGSEDHTLRELADALIARAGKGTIQATPSAMLRVMSVAARPFSPFMARMAGAGAWMDTGAMHFDLAPARAEFPDIPIHGLTEALAGTTP